MFLEDESTLKPPKLFIGEKKLGKRCQMRGEKSEKKTMR